MHRDDVGIALDHDGEVLLLDSLLGEIKTVKFVFLAVNFAFGRVLVLGDALVGTQGTTAECDDTTGNIVYRKHHALAEAVVDPTVALTLYRKTRREQELLLIARRQSVLRHLVALRRAETQTEFLYRSIGETACAAEIGHAYAHALVALVEVFGEVVGSPRIERKHALAVVVAADILLGHLLFANLDAVFFRDDFQSLGIGYAFVFHDKRYGIAALAASEALENAFRRRNHERRRLLVMERTARLIVHALAFERNIVAHDVHDVRRGINSVYGFTVNHSRGKDTNKRAKSKVIFDFDFRIMNYTFAVWISNSFPITNRPATSRKQ